jgi:hypothetical protein
MRFAFAVVLVGCAVDSKSNVDPIDAPPPAPVVDSMTPTSGGYGTVVTITGEHFGANDGYLELVPDVSYASVQGTITDGCQLQNLAWSDTQITGTIAFPCTSGTFNVHTTAGVATAGAFAISTTWSPGPGFDVGQLVDAHALSSSVIAALYRTQYVSQLGEVGLAVFSGSAIGVYPLPGMPTPVDTGPVFAKIVDGDDGNPVVIGTMGNGVVAMYEPAGSGSAASTPSPIEGFVIAAARDTDGMYAWLSTGSGVERVRPTDAWTIDRGPIAAADAPLDGAIGSDGTLWIAISEDDYSDPFDYQAYSSLQSLAPSATAFTAIERADPTSYDDFISRSHIELSGDGVGMVVVAYCEDNGTHVESPLPVRQRTAANTWSDAPVANAYTYVGGTLAGVVNADHVELVPDMSMPSAMTQVPVDPMQAEALVVDGSGALRPLIGASAAYAPTPP